MKEAERQYYIRYRGQKARTTYVHYARHLLWRIGGWYAYNTAEYRMDLPDIKRLYCKEVQE